MNPSRDAALQGFVKRLTSRSMLTEAEERAVLSLEGHVKQAASHVDFVRFREKVDHSSLIIDGLVGRFGQNQVGLRQITCLYIAGDMADLSSVMGPQAGWGLSALSRVTVLCVAHDDLRRLAANHGGLAEAFWRDCVADGSIVSDWVVNLGRRDAITRLAHLICEMAVRSEKAGVGRRDFFPLPITQVDLADATGLTSVHVNRMLRELRARSIVTVRLGSVTVHDWKQLVLVGNFDGAFMMLEGPFPRITELASAA